MSSFTLISDLVPKGDQPNAIKALSNKILSGEKHQVLLGVTGSGKTYTIAQVIASVQKPTLVIAPNKTLAAQLYHDFHTFYPENAVEYFVSYYDYYQPEAYIPSSDTYIQKDSSINDMIDKLRHSATRSVLSRRDVIAVASVSCIFGLGAPEDYLALRIEIKKDMELDRDKLLSDLVSIRYVRNDIDFSRGVFRVRGDRVEIFPAYAENSAIRIDFFGDQVENICKIDSLKGDIIKHLQNITIFPASHYVNKKHTTKMAIESIKEELKERIDFFRSENKLVEAQRIEERTNYDIEMILEIGYCKGIENYSRHFTNRLPGEAPPNLLDYFPDDLLICIDESHIAIPQIRAMYNGDRARKTTLVNFGFRLPSALDNRPFKFEEFAAKISQVIYISATPAEYELGKGKENIVELIARPTGLLDPAVEVKKATNQVDDLLEEILIRQEQNERILVTTLTKKMAENLTDYYADIGIKVQYLHSDINTFERVSILHDLRMGKFDVLIGINLLREGLDLPEVSLVAILDADKEGFLRSVKSLIQTCGRASRNVNGKVIMYADTVTKSMQKAIDETKRRRKIQKAYNLANNITPKTISKNINDIFASLFKDADHDQSKKIEETISKYNSLEDLDKKLAALEKEMKKAARELEFEKAAEIRDYIKELEKMVVV